MPIAELARSRASPSDSGAERRPAYQDGAVTVADDQPMEMNPQLLRSVTLSACPIDLNSCLNAHGLYNPLYCVLRLSPEVHRRLAALPDGITSFNEVQFEGLQAFSTYLHETVHWWQHIGSTAGLVLSLSHPAQAHANYSHLKRLLRAIGPKKSVLEWVEEQASGGGPETPAGIANTIVNNHFDIEFFRTIALHPRLSRTAADHVMFESVGHSYGVTYGNVLLDLAATVGDDFAAIPDPRTWEGALVDLRHRKVAGHFRGSPIRVSPVGAYDLFEGQARFAQLQYLFFGSGQSFGWEDARTLGMLSDVYVSAFNAFLELASIDWPPSIDHPTVALFLLVCDVALNPGTCFPFPLRFAESFIEDVDPGIRFQFLCRAVATKHRRLATRITEYSRDEYLEVSAVLAASLLIDGPIDIAQTVAGWARDNAAVESLAAEHDSFAYKPSNLPIRLLFGHFVEFCNSKIERPEFFCWPGAWMAGHRASPEAQALLERHSAPFVDKPDDAAIYPRLMRGREESVVHEAFSSFYATNVTYDLTRQWVAQPGPFKYDYGWLSAGSDAAFKQFGARHFNAVYGVHPDAFELSCPPR